MAVIHYLFFVIYTVIWSTKKQHHHWYDHDALMSSSTSTSTSTSSSLKYNTLVHSHEKTSGANKGYEILEQSLIDKNHIHITFEPGYPKRSKLHYFPTVATEKEMAKHDRYIVHGMLYTDMLNDEYLSKHWNIHTIEQQQQQQQQHPEICITIFMKHRSVPYINALLMSFMMSHEEEEEDKHHGNKYIMKGEELLSLVDFHLLDVERRVELEYDRQRQKILSLPFLHVHHPYHSDTHQKGNHRYNQEQNPTVTTANMNQRLEQIENYIHAANQCILSNLKYCLIMQEYNIVPIDFVSSLKKFIIEPLEQMEQNHDDSQRRQSENNHDPQYNHHRQHRQPQEPHFTILSLFSPIDSSTQSIMKIHDVNYSRHLYKHNVGKINSERSSFGLPVHQSNYRLRWENNNDNGIDNFLSGGYNSATFFLTKVVKDQLLPFLKIMKENEVQHVSNDSTSSSNSSNNRNKQQNCRGFDLEHEFTQYTNTVKLIVEPSLVNRIGFYDEDYQDCVNDSDVEKNEKERVRDNDDSELLGITNWLTDPRYISEAGEYWEGRDMYCMKSNGEWVEKTDGSDKCG